MYSHISSIFCLLFSRLLFQSFFRFHFIFSLRHQNAFPYVNTLSSVIPCLSSVFKIDHICSEKFFLPRVSHIYTNQVYIKILLILSSLKSKFLLIKNGNDLSPELLLTTRQKTKLRNVLNNNISTDIKLSKAQILKLLQYEGFLVSLLSKIAGLLMTVTVPLVKNILAPLGIKAAASAIDAGIQKKKIHGSGTTTLIIANKEMNDILNEDSNILLKGVIKTIRNETKEQKKDF